MRKSRKEINIYLTELDKFLEGKPIEEQMTLLLPLLEGTPGPLGEYDRELEFKNIEKAINPQTQQLKKSTARRARYILSVAYNIDWEEVYNFSYEDVFNIVLCEELAIPYTGIEKGVMTYLPKLYIPKGMKYRNVIFAGIK